MSVTENYLLEANLEDLVHGLVTGESVLEPGTRDNERIWRSDFSQTSLLSISFCSQVTLFQTSRQRGAEGGQKHVRTSGNWSAKLS